MGGPLERVTMKNGSVLKLNAEDRQRYADQGLVAEDEAPAAKKDAAAPVAAKAVKKSKTEDKAVAPPGAAGQE